MELRRATKADLTGVNHLLRTVLAVHKAVRPDLFCGDKKYTDKQLIAIFENDDTPVFVADDGGVIGYVFCVLQTRKNDAVLADEKTLYIDDLCVDERERNRGVATALYQKAVAFAKEQNCDSITLNVWAGNDSALRFYEKCGFAPRKTLMEQRL